MPKTRFSVFHRSVGGWQLGGVYVFQAGFPVSFGTNYFLTGQPIKLDNPQVGQWFNQAAFVTVSTNTVTGQPANNLRTNPTRYSNVRLDNVNNFDFSVVKDT